jgi:RND superfamily putative drug exporter
VQAQALGASLLGTRTTSKVTIVAATSGGQLTSADVAAITREARLARQVAGVQSVKYVALSPAGDAVQLTATARRDASDVAGLKPVVAALQATFPQAGAPPGLQLHLAGQVAANAANNANSNKAMRRIALLSVALIIVLLLIVLRSPVAVVITFIPSVVALFVSEQFIAGLGAHGLQISSVTQTLLTVLILGAGTDYGLFLVYRFREEMHAGAGGGGHAGHYAVVRALTRVGESITASAGTVILALLTLLFAGFGLYHDLGVPLALGIAITLLAGLTLLPALLAVSAGWMFRSRSTPDSGTEQGLWGRVATWAVRRPAAVLVIGVLAFAALGLAATGYKTASLSRSTNAPAGSDAALGNAILASDFPQSTASPSDLIVRYATPVWDHPQDLVTAADQLRNSGLFTGLAGPLDPNGTSLSPAAYASAQEALGDPRKLPLVEPASAGLPASVYDAYRASAQYVSPDGLTVRFAAGLVAGPQQGTAAMNATPRVRSALSHAAAASHAVSNGVAGQAAGLYDVASTANGDMARIIPIAVLAIAILLGLVLRSLVAPVYLVLTIAASYLAALGLTTFLVITLGGQDGLVFILPFLMFVFLLALGEDYNILIMTRIREEARTLPLEQAVVRAIGRTGPTVTSAGLVLAGTFAVFAVAGGGVMGGQLQAIGLGLALGVLLDTFGVRTLLVPSIVVLLGRWNWWPSRLKARSGMEPRVMLRPVRDDMPGSRRGRGRQSQHSLSLTGDLIGRPARQRRRWDKWVIPGVWLAGIISGAALANTSWPLGLALMMGPMLIVLLLVLASAVVTAGPRRRAREAALAELKAAHRAWVASYRHADIPQEVIELMARRRFTPARERYQQLTGAPQPVAEFVLDCYQVDVARARATATTRPDIPPQVVDLIIAGQRARAAARYAALKAVPLDAAVAVLDAFP